MRQTVDTSHLFPLVLGGKGLGFSPVDYDEVFERDPFLGFKIRIPWLGNDYGDERVEDMVGPSEIEAANKHSLIIMLHVPRSGRLADPEVQEGVRWLSGECGNASIVLAHCGRCYLPSEMRRAIGALPDLENVYLDTSMVMDPLVLQMVMETVGSERMLFATDFPVAAMRGRRVRVAGHWVDVVLEDYPQSGYRVQSNNMRATFMSVEIAVAIRDAADKAGISDAERDAIFHDNGWALLETVDGGDRLDALNRLR